MKRLAKAQYWIAHNPIRTGMKDPPPAPALYTKKNLENYARAYIGGYLSAVEKERPDHLPLLARSAPHRIEVCAMPNRCLCMFFERSDKETVVAEQKDWAYVEEKVGSGQAHLVAVYPHEGATVADAIARGKRDAVRDVKTLEDSHITRAVSQLERTLEELTTIEKDNVGLRRLAEKELSKLGPVREAVMSAGPEMDMLALVDALKNYPVVPVEVGIETSERQLLENISKDLGDLSDVIGRVEAQDKKVAELEESLKRVLVEFNQSIEERISKGLAIILSSSDRKIDKGLAALLTQPKGEAPVGSTLELEARLRKVEETLPAVTEAPDVSEEVLLVLADLRQNVSRLNARVTKIEQYLAKQTAVRTLKRKQ